MIMGFDVAPTELKSNRTIRSTNISPLRDYRLLAFVEYKLINKYRRMEWESRTLLSQAYEKAGRYSEALQELDWIISQKPRQDVLNAYVKRRDDIKTRFSVK